MSTIQRNLIQNKEEGENSTKAKLMNDGSKEPQEQDNYIVHHLPKKCWFWASVDVFLS